MPQSRVSSFVEQVCNIGSGMMISLLTWVFIIEPVFNISKRFAENLQITAIFTVISLVRGFIWRRLFNYSEQKKKVN